ncbi:MAG: hypothetical protein JNM34_03200 [Chthonomonadaceae bacterium]|nr:hypothetical protein [Chthonomonadaceae bacterium]
MKRTIASILALSVVAALLSGCGSGETTSTELNAERDQMQKQVPPNQEPAPPSTDVVQMNSGGSGGGEASNEMPKGIRGK